MDLVSNTNGRRPLPRFVLEEIFGLFPAAKDRIDGASAPLMKPDGARICSLNK